MTHGRPLYNSLEDYLIAEPLTVNGQMEDGGRVRFPVKGRELEATILFADIASFSSKTAALDPTETLAFVNHFFAWTLTEGLNGTPGIVDKYIGDAAMIVFSKDFGSEDPFADAIRVGTGMGANDSFSFSPHVGIASGTVIVGYVGTPTKFNCSVFGAPVAAAARCSSIGPSKADSDPVTSWVTFLEDEWSGRALDAVVPPGHTVFPDGTREPNMQRWALSEARSAEFKNMGEQRVQHLVSRTFHSASKPAEEWARSGVAKIKERGRKWTRDELPQPPKPLFPEGYFEPGGGFFLSPDSAPND